MRKNRIYNLMLPGLLLLAITSSCNREAETPDLFREGKIGFLDLGRLIRTVRRTPVSQAVTPSGSMS